MPKSGESELTSPTKMARCESCLAAEFEATARISLQESSDGCQDDIRRFT